MCRIFDEIVNFQNAWNIDQQSIFCYFKGQVMFPIFSNRPFQIPGKSTIYPSLEQKLFLRVQRQVNLEHRFRLQTIFPREPHFIPVGDFHHLVLLRIQGHLEFHRTIDDVNETIVGDRLLLVLILC